MAVSTCVVSGTVYTTAGAAFAGVNVYAYMSQPFIYTDGTLIPSYSVSTTTAANGTWSLTLVETATSSKTMVIAFEYPDGGSSLKRKEYTVTIPNSASANFSTLASGQ